MFKFAPKKLLLFFFFTLTVLLLICFRSRRDNKLFLFGNHMPRLVDMINKNASRFKDLPIGPIGAHIELAKGKSREIKHN
jgi:hypothetical protein